MQFNIIKPDDSVIKAKTISNGLTTSALNLNKLMVSEIDDKNVDVISVNRNKILVNINIDNIKQTTLSQNHNMSNYIGFYTIMTSEYENLFASSKKIMKQDMLQKYFTFSEEFESIPHTFQFYIIFLFNDNEAVVQELYFVSIPLRALYLHFNQRYGKQ